MKITILSTIILASPFIAYGGLKCTETTDSYTHDFKVCTTNSLSRAKVYIKVNGHWQRSASLTCTEDPGSAESPTRSPDQRWSYTCDGGRASTAGYFATIRGGGITGVTTLNLRIDPSVLDETENGSRNLVCQEEACN